MFSKTLAPSVALVALLTGAAQASPKPDGTWFEISGVDPIPITTPGDFAAPLATILANSDKIAAAAGTAELLSVEAAFVHALASDAISTDSAVTVFVTNVASTPIVQVSAVGGTDVVTLATGTVGSVTTIAGHAFTAAVQNAATNQQGGGSGNGNGGGNGTGNETNNNGAVLDKVASKGVLVGAASVIAAVAFGALSVL
ncbi:hypothetical protein C8Q76DRAFT_430636 [Earliella scabrosa]|nr:hypothetical protein C8Q76DRAFT_430636 [Earliella scabrosa]